MFAENFFWRSLVYEQIVKKMQIMSFKKRKNQQSNLRMFYVMQFRYVTRQLNRHNLLLLFVYFITRWARRKSRFNNKNPKRTNG